MVKKQLQVFTLGMAL